MLLGYMSALVVGLSLGLIGAGGSILTIPVFVYLMDISPELATAYSLFVAGAIATLGAWQANQDGKIDLKMGLIFAIPSFVGVYWARTFVLPGIPVQSNVFGTFSITRDTIIMLVFAVVMLASAISMIKPSKTTKAPSSQSAAARYTLISVEGFIVGAITGFVGAGGGFLTIPALVILLGMEMKTAIGTSLMIIAIKSLFGFFATTPDLGSLDWNMLSIFTGIAFIGIVIGGRLNRLISSETLKPGFGWFVLLMGGYILARELIG